MPRLGVARWLAGPPEGVTGHTRWLGLVWPRRANALAPLDSKGDATEDGPSARYRTDSFTAVTTKSRGDSSRPAQLSGQANGGRSLGASQRLTRCSAVGA